MVSSTGHYRDQPTSLSLALSLGTVADRKIRKLGRRAAGGEGDGEFACKTCGRSFPTFQALGGHRTSHLRGRHGQLALALAGDHYSGNKPKKATSSTDDDQKPAAAHQCHVCGLGFETGQALGGAHAQAPRGDRRDGARAGAARSAPAVRLAS